MQKLTYIAFLNAFWRRTVPINLEPKRFNDTSLSILQGCARRGPGKIRFSRKLYLKIAKISKIALLNDPKKNFQKKSQNLKVQFLVEKWLSLEHLLRKNFSKSWKHVFYTNWSILSIFEKNFFWSKNFQSGLWPPCMREIFIKVLENRF